jgi:hypothetical protein
LFAAIVTGDIEFIANVSVRIVRKTYPAGLRDSFETNRHVDNVPEYVAGIFDDVADIDPDPKFNTLT